MTSHQRNVSTPPPLLLLMDQGSTDSSFSTSLTSFSVTVPTARRNTFILKCRLFNSYEGLLFHRNENHLLPRTLAAPVDCVLHMLSHGQTTSLDCTRGSLLSPPCTENNPLPSLPSSFLYRRFIALGPQLLLGDRDHCISN